MSKLLRGKAERPEHFEVEYDLNYERHKIISSWSEERAEKFKKRIIEDIVAIDVPEEEAVKNYSELCDIFVDWMQGKTTEYDENKFKRLKFSSISPNKGFYIIGNKGTGKTTFMDAFRRATRKYVDYFGYRGLQKTSGIDIRNEYAAYGFRKSGYEGFEGGIEKYIKPMHRDTGRECEVLYIDDFLYEGENLSTSYYGNSAMVLEDVIKARMDRGLLTFITSNFEPSSFSEPVLDRMKESFNLIVINSKESFRA